MGNICTSQRQELAFQPLQADSEVPTPLSTPLGSKQRQEVAQSQPDDTFDDDANPSADVQDHTAVPQGGESEAISMPRGCTPDDRLTGVSPNSELRGDDLGCSLEIVDACGQGTAGQPGVLPSVTSVTYETGTTTPRQEAETAVQEATPWVLYKDPEMTACMAPDSSHHLPQTEAEMGVPFDRLPELPDSGEGVEVEEIAPLPIYRAKRRCSVSAEVASQAGQIQQQVRLPRKDEMTELVILKAMAHSFLFTGLEDEQKIECASAMFRKEVEPGDVLIRQGEEGDNFYVIAEGVFTALIRQTDLGEKVVHTYEGKGAFGELALMYNCPRAATIQANTKGLVWGMDRSTFRRIILASAIDRRERFEGTLREMSIFAGLSPYQRASIADCLGLEVYEAGTYILTEGEELTASSKFYIVEEGRVACYRTVSGVKKMVKEIPKGGFFGEVALVTKSSIRVADCLAADRCKVLAMGRDAFERLMGPCDEVLKREVEAYMQLNASINAATDPVSINNPVETVVKTHSDVASGTTAKQDSQDRGTSSTTLAVKKSRSSAQRSHKNT